MERLIATMGGTVVPGRRDTHTSGDVDMKRHIIRILLRILNSPWLNSTPGRYVLANGIEAFTLNDLRAEVAQKPSVTVDEVVRMAETWGACPVRNNGLSVLEGGMWREATTAETRAVTTLRK